MNQKEKQLLLIDLCARLPYGVRCTYPNDIGLHIPITEINVHDDGLIGIHGTIYNLYEIKPYLRPMKSMTEEEKENILQTLNIHGDIDTEGNLLLGAECNILTLKVCKKYLGELNKRMFDVCHLIEKGLALEAPEGMYEIKIKNS